MTEVNRYSQFFCCIHDEIEPAGKIGRGSHYSVLRAPCWHTPSGQVSHTGSVQDFAVVWDEDHDTRIIPVLEALYFEGLLHPIAFVGERKGMVTFVFSENFISSAIPSKALSFCKLIENTVDRVVDKKFQDYWSSNFGAFRPSGKPKNPEYEEPFYDFHRDLIDDSVEKVDTYLQNINNLWQLGQKDYK